jgi:hypothetical protein
LIASLAFAGCARRDPEAERRTVLEATAAKLRACLPKPQSSANPRLALLEVKRTSDETRARLVAYAVGEAVDFDLPVYLLSRGRWLVNERERVYLRDDQCREYKLQDRRETSGVAVTPAGRARLAPGAVCEFTLRFPPLSPDAHQGALVYGSHVLPFSLLEVER